MLDLDDLEELASIVRLDIFSEAKRKLGLEKAVEINNTILFYQTRFNQSLDVRVLTGLEYRGKLK